ncbi:MAG: hypothetical protein L0I76_01255, partial [Pseudonocardia sp.]|nr:hypothetical protein [Pseudonocardia sp.]
MAATTVTTGPIRLRWVSAISSDVTDLLDRAARFDAEMGFGPPSRPGRSRSSGPTWVIEIETCLHRHGVSHDDDYVLAGALTVGDIASGIGVVELVVDPCRRSIGVATAVLEELGIEAAGAEGWAGTGLHRLHGVAYGSHPAAGRLARRYGASHTATRHHLVLPEDEGYRPDRSATSGGPATTTLNLEEGTARVRLAADDDPSEISD